MTSIKTPPILFLCVVVALGSLPALANITLIDNTYGANAEPHLMGTGYILDTLYGSGNVVEVEVDQLWSNPGDNATAKAEAKWAGYTQNFGYLPGASGGTFNHLFTVSTNGYLYGTPSATHSKAETGYIFRFADDPSGACGASMWSSQVSDNWDDKDHMRTFSITGGASAGNYVICWEDLPSLGDKDYQDLIVEVSGVTPIPEPATVCLLGLGGLVSLCRRKSR